MDTVRRMKLQNLRERIVQDVDIVDIVDYLISKQVLLEDDLERVNSEKTRKDKTRHLLDLLPHKGIEAFQHFVDALKGPYLWLSEQLQAEGPQSYQSEEKSYFDTLLLGGLPQPPPYNVDRREKIEEVRSHLRSIKRGKYVVLHGMTGSGKSCLAAAALDNKQLLIEKFNGAVYWISVGEVSTDDLLCHMTDLMDKLSYHPSVELETQIQSSTSVKGARDSLRRYFTSDALRDGLLILDDVCSPELIEAFDIGCKILVTTKDIDVMKSVAGRDTHIQISKGFTENESLCLLAKCVGVDISELPYQAKKIHQLCKGYPLVIALIGAQLAENQDDVQRNQGRWDYYIDKLTKRDYVIRRHSFSPDRVFGAIVNNLPDDMKSFYLDFALFVEDVNIRPEVLGTLWSKNKYEVEDIMSAFLKKSLAVSKWNELLNSYVYGIHDMLLNYLRQQFTHEEKKALHRKLLDAYTKVCNGNFSKLPNDNYIFSYIGYHLIEGEMWDLFPKLFLDLEFIGAKLKVTGPGDLLVDYKKYKKYISQEVEHQSALLNDFEQFVQAHGLILQKYQELDIIQCGLQEPQNSHVYKEAVKIARERPNRLYFEFLMHQHNISQPHTLSLKEEVFTACFTTKENKVLTANGNGVVNLWDTDYSRIVYTFPGHKLKILHLEVRPDGAQFLSCSEDCTVKLWDLEGAICKNKDQEEFDEHGCSLKTPSPRMRQDEWNDMFSSDIIKDRSKKTFLGHQDHVVYATYSHDNSEVMSCSKDGSVKVWNCDSGETRLTLKFPVETGFASTCIFSGDGSLILFAGNDTVYVYDNTGRSVTNFKNSGCVIGVMNVECNEVAVVCSNSIRIWSWDCDTEPETVLSAQLLSRKNSPSSHMNGGTVNNSTYSLVNLRSQDLFHSSCANFTCCALSENGQFIIAASSDFSISVWNVDDRKLVKQYQDHIGFVRCLDTFWGASYQLLLSGSDDKTIKIWHMELVDADVENETRLQQHFDAVWDGNSSDPSIPLLVAPDSFNKLQLLRGRSIVTESVPESVKVKTCQLSSCGHFVVYGCCDGFVKNFDIKRKKTSILMKLNGAVHYLHLCYCNGAVVIAADQDNNLKIWRGKMNEVGSLVTCAGQTAKVVNCFLIAMGQKLLSCAQDGSVKIWDTSTGNLVDVLMGRHTNTHVTMADLSSNEDLLVLCDASGNFMLIHLGISTFPPYQPVAKDVQIVSLQDSLRSCKLSHDGQFVALGQENGSIVLWDVKQDISAGTLNLHKSWVRTLVFAPPPVNAGASMLSTQPVILLSLADQIGWWDISQLTSKHTQRRRMSSGQRRKNRNSGSPKIGLNKITDSGTPYHEYLADHWIGKEGRGKPELLSCVKLIGREAKKIAASKDFSAFVTIDSSGIVYLMKVLR